MDFDLTDDQRLLTDSVTRLLGNEYGFEQRKALLKTETGWSEKLWGQYAELGLLGLPIAEDFGGFGGGPVDIMLLMQAFGRHLVLEPYLATVVLGAPTELLDKLTRLEAFLKRDADVCTGTIDVSTNEIGQCG